jgi:hypothetical protein
MAENIILHFRTTDRAALKAALDQLALPAGRSGEARRYPNQEDYTLTIYPYDHILTEYEPKDIVRLRSVLGDQPSASPAIELRRSAGNRAVNDATTLTVELLRLFKGVVDDTHSER